MKVSKEQMAANRARILEAASRLFRARGFDDVSVIEIMRAAGMTHGAFYGHFASKDDLIARAMEATVEGMTTDAAETLAGYALHYLKPEHRDDPANGCLFAALGSEAARGRDDARRILTDGLKRHLDELTAKAPGRTAATRRRAAVAGWASMMGALILSRMVDDAALSDELLAETSAALDP